MGTIAGEGKTQTGLDSGTGEPKMSEAKNRAEKSKRLRITKVYVLNRK